MGQHWSRLVRNVFVGLTVAALSLLYIPLHSSAATPSAAQGIQISPVLVNLNAETGQDYTIKLTITNVTAGPLSVTSEVNDFKAKDESGNPQVILDNNNSSSTYSLHTWIDTIPKLTLKAQESRSLSFTVAVPSNAEAGGHYGVIRFSGVPPAQSGQNVSLNASVGVLLLARVQGKITEQLSIKEMFIEKAHHRQGLVANGPLTIVSRIQNSGNVHVQPIGTLVVKDGFGKTVASYPFGGSTKNILPGSIRRYDQVFDKKFLFGRYTVNLSAAYGTTGGVLLGSTSFWVIPFKLILFLIALVTLAVFLTRRTLKRYKSRVIRQHQRPKKR
jgi:hypothetical protein